MISATSKNCTRSPRTELVDELYDSLVEIDKLKRELRKYQEF